MDSPLLYEINTRCWLQELSSRYHRKVTLGNVPEEEFAGWQRRGFTHIWLMGVWTTGPLARSRALADPRQRETYREALPDLRDEDVAGSPYAIADYQISPSLGGEEGLREFRRKFQERHLKLLLDFVPNHLGLDHRWLDERPDLFVQSAEMAPGTFRRQTQAGLRWLANGKDPYFAPWTDTVQLDYRRGTTRAAMKEVLGSIAQRCDGVRCDMAMLLLKDVFSKTWVAFPIVGSSEPSMPGGEFWAEAIGAIKNSHPGFLFLAEAYWGLEQRLQELGFDYTYDKTLYDRLIARNAAGVQQHLLGLSPKALAAGAHFMENHDEPRVSALLNPSEHRAAALINFGLPGMRFSHDGELTGARVRTPVQLSRRMAEPKQPEIEGLYEELLAALSRTVVGRGHAEVLRPQRAWPDNPTAENLVVIQWQADPSDFDLVAVNLAPHRSQGYVALTADGLSSEDWLMKDLLGKEQYVRRGDEMRGRGLYLDLPENGAQLFHFQRK